MKKKLKKLELSKETLRTLQDVDWSKAVGGSPTDEFWSCRVCYEEPISYNTQC